MHIKRLLSALSSGFLIAGAVPAFAFAATPSTVVVTPTHTQGWSTADTAAGGQVTYIQDASAPGGTGALHLTTGSTNPSKAQYMHAANISLGDVTNLSYSTKQVYGAPTADPSYQVAIDINGVATGGYTTLVFEPYWNGTVTPGTWQDWDVSGGQFWSSKNLTCSQGSLGAGAGGAPFYTLQQVKAVCPEAVVTAFGVNIGTYNPNYNVETDLMNFNGTTYDFEVTNVPSSKDDCKNDGYASLTTTSGAAYKNQGDCVSSVASNGNANSNPGLLEKIKNIFS